MARKALEMQPLQVNRLKDPGLHFVGGVAGLALQIAPGGSKSWVLRVMVGGRRREMGLGGFPDVTLAGAREAARAARSKIKLGIDPIDEARATRSALVASRAKDVTFQQCALDYLQSQEKSWSAKSHTQWLTSLENYVFPSIGQLLVRDVKLANILEILKPIWHTKTETASRIRGRIEKILDCAKATDLRAGENPARWKGHLDVMLAAPFKIQETEHFKALPYVEVGSFMQRLKRVEGQGAIALQFTILTAARSGQTRGATWSEIDFNDGTWLILKARMKAKRDHRVPLSAAALQILKAQPRFADTDLIFPSSKGKMLSDATISAVLKRMKVNAVPHGFRSTFKDWCSELTNYPREVSEMALAHTVGDKVEEAYRRGDLYMKRLQVMEDWAEFCSKPYVVRPKIVPISASGG